METDIQRERHAETETDGELEAETHEGRARNHIRRVERQQRQPGRAAAQTWKSVCEYRDGAHMNKSQRQLPGDRGRRLPCRHQLLEQHRLHSTFLRLHQVHKSLGTEKNMCAALETALAGEMVGGTVRGLGKREERQDRPEIRQTDGRDRRKNQER